MSTERPFEATAACARSLDDDDALAAFRDRFFLPSGPDGTEQVYFCGNSLGLQPRAVTDSISEVLEDWRRFAVAGHLEGRHPWLPYHEFLTEQLAELVGALPLEVVAMNTLTVNLHLMMVSFYRPTSDRNRILIEKHAFPSDRYAVESQIRFHGFNPADALVELTPRDGELCLRMEDVADTIGQLGDTLALAVLPGVQYYTGQYLDPAELTPLIHSVGAAAGYDLAHAAGNLPVRLHDSNADFAVWCSYKYMNAGPGAIAGCFVHERHARDTKLPRFAGWWGHDKQKRFLMGPDFQVMPGAEGWQLSNPSIFAAAPLLASLQVFHEAGIDRLREKSVKLTGFLEFLLHARLSEHMEIITPFDPDNRGCQLSLRVIDPNLAGKHLHHQLEQAGCIGDWREPDVIRVAPVPLYNRFLDAWTFVDTLAELLN